MTTLCKLSTRTYGRLSCVCNYLSSSRVIMPPFIHVPPCEYTPPCTVSYFDIRKPEYPRSPDTEPCRSQQLQSTHQSPPQNPEFPRQTSYTDRLPHLYSPSPSPSPSLYQYQTQRSDRCTGHRRGPLWARPPCPGFLHFATVVRLGLQAPVVAGGGTTVLHPYPRR
ncbi:hypothetical protein K491DRAFT_225240 [Lophiostoma macrostomum CBS 122681]|uniref:Uncharacterized protein n=1 Tax=Lophiostoma macrostomum CBS 122681 TaxID=1314788 RepID=A0A6A6TGZ4_9PLEO|nr:hypothetical protein K491DRAFT_225240 [Lophiostoma macrostomum CBS 122681]